MRLGPLLGDVGLVEDVVVDFVETRKRMGGLGTSSSSDVSMNAGICAFLFGLAGVSLNRSATRAAVLVVTIVALAGAAAVGFFAMKKSSIALSDEPEPFAVGLLVFFAGCSAFALGGGMGLLLPASEDSPL